MPEYRWKPIEPLADAERSIDLAAIQALYDSWRASKLRLQAANPAQLVEFNRRLVRRLSVETGILERLYDLDRGTTEALVAQGFAEDLISHASTNIEPSRLIDILRDQEAAVHLMIDCVSTKRALSKSVMHELHAILTRHQDTTTAVDQFGNRLEIALLKGRFKQHANNPRRPDGELHEYCPPVHVEAEVENLLGWLNGYSGEDPVIVGAWLHHRFTQIHPYQDGNGRVARALTTLVLLRADLLPLVVDRDLRTEYIGALEQADAGSLTALADIFARLERKAILEALSVDASAEISHQEKLASAVISSLADKFSRRREEKLATLRQVNLVAISLRDIAKAALEASVAELAQAVNDFGVPESFVRPGGSDWGSAHWYRFEVTQSAREAGKFANFAEDHYFLKASFRVGRERLVFVVSFHHVGRELTGIMEATAFSQLESFEGSDDRESVAEKFSLCTLEPFVFTHQTSVSEIAESFRRWLDAALAVALKEYGDRL